MPTNIFVMGLDELNRPLLEALPGAEDYTFHQLLTVEELQSGDIAITDLVTMAMGVLDSFDGPVDAVVGYWDFPVTMLVPIICERYGLRSAGLGAVVRCEHKYWSRLVQAQVIDEHPGFGMLDLDAPHPTLPEGLSYPVWIKPVKSTESEGAFRVEDDEQLQDAVVQEREIIGRLGDPFNDILALLDLPPEIAEIGGNACMVEESATGRQITVEGYSLRGDVEVFGVVDSHHYPGVSSFLRYQYPSTLPEHLQDRLADVSRRAISAVGLDDTTFNIEFFWDDKTETLTLLEINPRHSQSHAPLFQLVDGRPNHATMVHLALGETPNALPGDGEFAVAAKWYLRHFSDGIVRRLPSPEEISAIEERIPGTTIQVSLQEGQRLSDLRGGDSYSYALAEIFVGGQDEEELQRRYDTCVEALGIEIDDDEPEGT